MNLICIGTNHRLASTDVRERYLETANVLGDRRNRTWLADAGIAELVILATCNRVEIYAAGPKLTRTQVLDFVQRQSKPTVARGPTVVNHGYDYENEEASWHLFRVAAGLDSMIVGESEIIGQVARARREAESAGTCQDFLGTLFAAAVKAGRRARRETGIGRGAASVSSAAVNLARKTVGSLHDKRVLVVGTGKMGRRAIETLHDLGARDLTLANRSLARAQALASEVGGGSCDLRSLEDVLPAVDVVFTSTSAPDVILDPVVVHRALTRRANGGPIVMVDIAVPRDIDPAVGELDGVVLFGLDDLQDMIGEHLAERAAEIPQAEHILREEMRAYEARLALVSVDPLITELRRWAEHIRKSEVARRTKRTDSSTDLNAELEDLSQSLVNKLLLPATRELRTQAEKYGRTEYAGMVRDLFDLDEGSSGATPDR